MPAIFFATLPRGTTGTAAALLPDDASPLATGAATVGVGGLLLALTATRATVAAYPLALYSPVSLSEVAVGEVVALGRGPAFAAFLARFVAPRGSGRPLDRRRAILAGAAVIDVALLVGTGAGYGAAAATSTTTTGTAAGPSAAVPASTSVDLLGGIALGLLAGLAYAV